MKGTVIANALVPVISFVLTGCATVTSPDRIVAGLLDGLLMPRPHKVRTASGPQMLNLNGRPVSTHNPRTVQTSPSNESVTTPPTNGRSVPDSTLAPPESSTTRNTFSSLAASESPPTTSPHTREEPPKPAVSSASTRVLERIREAYRGFQYDKALSLAQNYVESTVPSDRERAEAAFIGAAAAYVLSHPALMDDLLGESIRIAPYLKPDPNTLPRAVCLRHQALLAKKGE